MTEKQQVGADTEKKIYNDLYTFISRYYDDGDFLTNRRISTRKPKYAVPYNGEEVLLHWANKDQYYIKTGEHFTNYKFEVDGKMHICFIDPKGLQHQINVNENNKVQFSRDIKDYEKQLNKKRGNDDVQLHSCIISQTDLDEVKKNNDVQSVADLNEMNIFFPEEDGYVDGLFREILGIKKSVTY